MLVRVADFGAAHPELFPASSPGGEKFARVSAAVAAIEEHLKNRVLGKAGARGVNPTTRAAVFSYMRTLARAARRISRRRRNTSPFLLPRRRTLKLEVATARAFLEEAETRQDQFVEMGLPATFVSDFRLLVDELEQAVNARLNSKTIRGQAQAGIATSVRQGLEIVRDLDVLVEIATPHTELLAATWRVARRIAGLYPTSTDGPTTVASTTEGASAEQPSAGPPVTTDAAVPAAVEVATPDVTTIEAPAVVLEQAS
jgi:hypothetical protein